MRCWELRSFGDDGLALADRPDPIPGAGEVLIEIDAVTLNYRDLSIARGIYAPSQTLPLIPASDAVGRVVAVGAGSQRWRVGDRVIACYMQTWDRGPSQTADRQNTLGSPLDGVLSKYRVFPEQFLVRAPDRMSDAECAALPIAALTAWCALFDLAVAKPGETVVVQGSGGVSTFAAQFALASGMRVLAISRSDAKANLIRKLGVDTVILTSRAPEWSKAILEATGGNGADIVIDVGGESTFAESLSAAGQNGRIIAVGFLGGASSKIELRHVIAKNLVIRGITVGSRESFEEMLSFINRTAIKPVIDKIYSFDEVPQAYLRLASADQHGKICINMKDA